MSCSIQHFSILPHCGSSRCRSRPLTTRLISPRCGASYGAQSPGMAEQDGRLRWPGCKRLVRGRRAAPAQLYSARTHRLDSTSRETTPTLNGEKMWWHQLRPRRSIGADGPDNNNHCIIAERMLDCGPICSNISVLWRNRSELCAGS